MAWTSLLVNPEGLRSIYGAKGPPLTGVRLVDLALLNNGPTLKARIDLTEYPADPPRKWATRGCNTVQIELSFLGVKEIELERFDVENIVDIDLGMADGLRFSVSTVLGAPGVRLHGVADFMYLSKISAYLNEV